MGGDTELEQLAKTDRNPIQETRYQELIKAGGGGGNTYDSLLTSLPKVTDFATQVNEGENTAFNDYLTFLKSQPTSVDFYGKQLEKAGIPGLQKAASTLQQQIYDTEDAIRRVEPDVSATSRNSIVTEAQRRGMVEARQKPLVENLGWIGQSLGRITQAIGTGKADAIQLTSLNSADQAKLVDAYKTKLDIATRQGDRALQAFSEDIGRTLDVTLAKIHRGEQVSDTEAANAFELLKMQKQAEIALKTAQPNTEIVEIGGHKKLIDKNTGNVISDLGSSKGPSGSVDISNYLNPPSDYVPNNPFGIDNSIYNWINGG